MPLTQMLVLQITGNLQQFAFVQHTFDNKEHAVELRPHGNSKEKTPYRCTKPSTLHLIQENASKKPASNQK